MLKSFSVGFFALGLILNNAQAASAQDTATNGPCHSAARDAQWNDLQTIFSMFSSNSEDPLQQNARKFKSDLIANNNLAFVHTHYPDDLINTEVKYTGSNGNSSNDSFIAEKAQYNLTATYFNNVSKCFAPVSTFVMPK